MPSLPPRQRPLRQWPPTPLGKAKIDRDDRSHIDGSAKLWSPAYFRAGAGEPVVVVGNPGAAAPLRAAFAATKKGIASVTPPAARAGFAVTFGILLDTIIVRSVLVTALNLNLGRWMWWPSRLARKPDPAAAELSQERATAMTAS